jgi:plastocyanin
MNMNNPTYQMKNSTSATTQPANSIYIRGMAFSPATLTVSAGTTVTWTNMDGVTHTVTSDSTLFNSGNILLSATYSYKFNTAGTFPYHCSIHPSMKAQVIVTAYVAPSGY